jgi:hypothetical protein
MKKIVFSILCAIAVLYSQAQATKDVKTDDGMVNITDQQKNQQIISDYKGPCGCGSPMTADELKQTITEIKIRNSDVRMLTYAKQEIRDKCLLASQIKEITLLFTYDDTRCNFAAFARKYTYDLGNYKAELQQFLIPSVNTRYGQVYTKNTLNKLWVNPSYSAESARHFYYYGY